MSSPRHVRVRLHHASGGVRSLAANFPRTFRSPAECLSLNGRYADRVLEYAREILTNYPVDGLRTDILDHNTSTRTPGDKAFYRELYGEEMPAKYPSWQREMDFRLKSISRFVRRFHDACKAVKPSVEIWHNWFNDKNVVDLREHAPGRHRLRGVRRSVCHLVRARHFRHSGDDFRQAAVESPAAAVPGAGRPGVRLLSRQQGHGPARPAVDRLVQQDGRLLWRNRPDPAQHGLVPQGAWPPSMPWSRRSSPT